MYYPFSVLINHRKACKLLIFNHYCNQKNSTNCNFVNYTKLFFYMNCLKCISYRILNAHFSVISLHNLVIEFQLNIITIFDRLTQQMQLDSSSSVPLSILSKSNQQDPFLGSGSNGRRLLGPSTSGCPRPSPQPHHKKALIISNRPVCPPFSLVVNQASFDVVLLEKKRQHHHTVPQSPLLKSTVIINIRIRIHQVINQNYFYNMIL